MSSGPRARAGIVLAMAMASAALAYAWTPTIKVADSRPRTPLSELVPTSFGDWVEDRSLPVVLPAPDVEANLNKVYNQVLARTYTNPQGYRIMLSIAYGGDQSDGMSVHRPEVCYPAQGFEVTRVWSDRLQLPGQTIPITRATSRLGPRNEPLTYWIVNGDEVVGRGFGGRVVQLKYTLRGRIPDGMLVRVSSIDTDPVRAHRIQDEFSRGLIGAVDAGFRVRLVGMAPG